MFFVVVGTHTKCVINEFALDARIDILIFQCHTVTNGIDLRRSPQEFSHCTFVTSLKLFGQREGEKEKVVHCSKMRFTKKENIEGQGWCATKLSSKGGHSSQCD